MQFMILFTRHPDKAETPAPAGLREAEFEKIRGLYTDGLVQHDLASWRRWRRLHDCGSGFD
jgi:hypothetical protein